MINNEFPFMNVTETSYIADADIRKEKLIALGKSIMEFVGIVCFLVCMWFALVIGQVYEDHARCKNGYQPACEALKR